MCNSDFALNNASLLYKILLQSKEMIPLPPDEIQNSNYCDGSVEMISNVKAQSLEIIRVSLWHMTPLAVPLHFSKCDTADHACQIIISFTNCFKTRLKGPLK